MILDLIVLFFGCRRILYSSETPRNCKAYKQKKLCFSRKLFEKQSFFTWVVLTKKIPGAVIKTESKPSAAGSIRKGAATE